MTIKNVNEPHLILGYIFLLFLSMGCESKKTEILWNKSLYVIGSQSSPRTSDLNGDGVLDLVMGAGKNEFQHCEQGVLAINGSNGEVIWQQESDDQVFASPTFYDINQDDVNDVFIGGRSPQLKALDGKTGDIIWSYDYREFSHDPILQHARFNFYNCSLIPDQNEDGLDDLLVLNGGNPNAEPHSVSDRYPGVLMLVDSRSGNIIAADTMPDGAESYMSPLFIDQKNSNKQFVVFGSGGETLSGSLFIIELQEFKKNGLKKSVRIAEESGHGFIAPPVAADINGDGYYDIIAISHASTAIAIDGRSFAPIWENKIKNTESSNAFAVGYFNEDEIPDFFTFVSYGIWPESTGSLQVLLDGISGEIIYENTLGCSGFSSPVVFDLNNDGWEEAIISINEYDCTRGYVDSTDLQIENKLVAIDFKNNSINQIDVTPNFKNIFSTPWIGDLDEDGYLDIVHCQYYSPSNDLMQFLGMNIKRISTGIKISQRPIWGAYMGADGDGIFKVK